MDCCITLIPWSPRTVLNPVVSESEDEITLCERTIKILQPIILSAIRAFPEAHRAMSLALMQFVPKTAA
ncbi:MAG TPA: hypothetical protein VEX68_02645 [Bryobacteraceae bacterium]|nr:hypothetical protein [Bryobacteraceae bacterium]